MSRDLIDRQEAIEAVAKGLKNVFVEYKDVAEKLIGNLPSAQLESCGDVISREYLKEHIEACWINGRPRHAPELNELLSWIDDVPFAQTDLQPTCNQLATDCISRHGAIDMIMGQPPEAHYPSWYAEQIKALPPAHPEIIRCRNCKYYMLGSDDVRYCFNHDDDILWQDDDFCSRAERREDERNDI